MGWQDDPLAYSVDANTQKFLDFIGKAEGADYNTIVGGGRFDNYAAHPNVVGLRTKDGPSTAAGKYQIVNSTYQDVAPSLGIKDFSPESQDRIAVELIKRAGALEDVQKGNYNAAIKKLGSTWASLPSSPYSQPKRSQGWVESALDMVVSPAQAAQTKGSWMNDPVDGEAAPQATQAPAKGGWMDDPIVSEAAPQAAPKTAPKANQTVKLPDVEIPAKPLTDAGMNSDPTWIANAKRLYKETQGKDFKGADAAAADWLKNYVAQTNWNLAGTAGTIYDATTKLSPEGKQALLQSIQAYEAAPTSFESVGRAAKGIFTDPTTYLTGGVGGLITKTLGRKAAAEGVKQAIKSGLEKELVTAATKKAVGTGAAYGAVNDLGKQGVQVAADGQDSIDLGQTGTAATIGGVTGGVINKVVDKVTGRAAVRKLASKSGSEEGAAIDAEIVQDLSKIAGNETTRGQPVQAIQANALEQKYVGDANRAIKALGKDNLQKSGLTADDIQGAIQNRRILTAEELDKLRGSRAGDALADAIDKAQRTRSLTAPVPAAGNILARTGRTLLDLAPIPQPLRYVGQRALGARKTREDVIQGLVSDKNVGAAEKISSVLGPSQATMSLEALQQQAARAQQVAQARAQAQAQARAQAQAQNAANRISVLQDTRMPLGGGFQELLQGGRSNLNLQSKEAIDALRLAKNRFGNDSPIGQAADQLLKSQPVKDENAFYGLQNWLRKTQESGVLAGGQPPGALSGVSPVRNPIAYKANVDNAMGALKSATDNAPSQDLAQFARKVAGTKSIADKEKLIADRIKNASQEEADFLNQFVSPLTNFGKK